MSDLCRLALTKEELRLIIEDFTIKDRIQLACPHNYEVVEVPLVTLCKEINKLQRKKLRRSK